MSYLELHDIHKSYYLDKVEFPVLKGINLNFNLGEFVSILGESGGGKSTLMNIIGGLDRQFQGAVFIDGKRLDHKDAKALDSYRRETVGYIYQSYNLISHLSVLDNVMIPLEMTTLSRREREQRARQLLDKVGLGGQMMKYPNHLSGGQKQRVAIARALASDPKVIIADEPTGALDAQNTKEVLAILDQIASEGRLVITVTHSQEVANSGTRIVHMENGKIDSDEMVKKPYVPISTPPAIVSRLLPSTSSYKNAAKHLRYNFWRNMLIVLGVTIGLFAVVLFNGIGNGTTKYVDQQINDMANPRLISVSAYTKPSESSASASSGSMSSLASMYGSGLSAAKALTSSQISQLEELGNVTSVSPSYTANSVTVQRSKGSAAKSTTISAIKNWNSSSSTSTLVAGTKPGPGEILLDKADATKLTKNWKSLVGTTISLKYQTLNSHKVLTTVKFAVKVSGIAEAKNSMGMTDLTAIDTATLTKAMKVADVSTQPTTESVVVNSIDNVKSVTSKINKLASSSDTREFTATGMSDGISTIKTYINLVAYILSGIAAISLVVSALMIIVTMFMSVNSRTKEIGILRALGQSKKDIRRLFTSESLILGVLSATLATAIAFGLGALANLALSSLASFDIVQITGLNVIEVFVMALIISLIAAYAPARHAARLNPIDALASD
ncbi:MAG: ATP-binding cassette domain-containing protein [Bifidobacteriaceae bacterium]|jgi:ABC-type lipoprotein export system ATPase subunit/ABC-type antimicrobial peptide transport system permease subunit|nr:ATP-binding cassette domain-containing protein [Bifidobacteriaceae bacterium]